MIQLAGKPHQTREPRGLLPSGGKTSANPYVPLRPCAHGAQSGPMGTAHEKRRVAHHNDPPPAREKEELGEKPLRASSSLRGAWKEKTAEGAPQTAFLERRYSIPKEYGFCVNKP